MLKEKAFEFWFPIRRGQYSEDIDTKVRGLVMLMDIPYDMLSIRVVDNHADFFVQNMDAVLVTGWRRIEVSTEHTVDSVRPAPAVGGDSRGLPDLEGSDNAGEG